MSFSTILKRPKKFFKRRSLSLQKARVVREIWRRLTILTVVTFFGTVTPDNFFKDICDFLDSYHKAIDELEDEKIKAEKARKREEEEEKKAKKKEEMQKAKDAKVWLCGHE